jgi:2-methylisocitrate lyase-like PEP mutase family enzyme
MMAVRRLVQECIRAGLAGVRIDDQPLEGKRRTQTAGLEVVSLEQAVARYRAAVDMKNEIDPSFVIMAQCYARDASNGGLEDALVRLQAYEQGAGVDWVQLASPHSVDEIRQARQAVSGAFSFMRGHLPRFLSLQEHLDLGVNLAWYPSFTHQVMWAALWDFLQAFREQDVAAWEHFLRERKNRPYPVPRVAPDGEGAEKQQALEERYLSAEGGGKYRKAPAGSKGAT